MYASTQDAGSAREIHLSRMKSFSKFNAVLDAVADAPPPKFSGGGKWEGMHGTMGGLIEPSAARPGSLVACIFATD